MPDPRDPGKLSLSRLDFTLIAVGLAFGACSLAYPLGHDQGVHYYVGREWLRGALPYRDAFDYKPPGIFLIYAALLATFGEHAWAIRLAELGVILALGFACAALLPRPQARGTVGASCLLASFFYFGFFSFWDTAQCESWCALFATSSIAVALRAKRTASRAAMAGLLAGGAIIMKTPIVLTVAIAFGVAVRRTKWRGAVAFAAGTMTPAAILVGYFACRNGLSAMRETLVGATFAYVDGSRRVHSAMELVRCSAATFAWFNPYSSIVLAAIVFAGLRDLSSRAFVALRAYALAIAMTVAAYAAVAVQLKFYFYHYALFVPGLTVASMVVIDHIQHAVRDVRLWQITCAAAMLYVLTGERARVWSNAAFAVLSRTMGLIDDRKLDEAFAAAELLYDPAESRATGEWLRAHSSESETIAVRGFFPEVYAIARRSAPGRFFWTVPLTDPTRAYRQSEWIAEDAATLEATRPRFVVTPSFARVGPDSPSYFPEYERTAQFGRLVVLERRHAM